MVPTNQTSSRTLIPINIETLAGTSFELLVSPYEQIQSIKQKIERRECIPSSHQHLVFKSNELEDELCLNDYNIEPGTTIKLVLAMRGGPVNTKRVPIEDNFIRDMSDYIESSRDDCDLVPSSSSSNKNVTFLVLRDGDQFNFFQVIDRGDGTLSPLSGSMSAASMYNTHETLTVEPEPEFDQKRQDDDRKMKQKMELIRSKLKTNAQKDILLPPRPPSSSKPTKSNLIHHHHRRTIPIEATSTVAPTREHFSTNSSTLKQPPQTRSLSYSFSTNIFNPYNLLSTANINRANLFHEEDSEDDDDSQDEDDDDEDDDDDDQRSSSKQIFAARSFSPSIYYQKKHYHHHHHHHHHHHTTKKLFSQETATTTTTSTDDTNGSSRVLVDYIPRMSPTIPIVSTSSRMLSATKCLNTSDEPIGSDEKTDSTNDILYHHSHTSPTLELIDDETISSTNITRKPTADLQSRNETSLSKPIWTDDDEQINVSEEYVPGERTSTSQSMLFCHQNSSTDMTSISTLPQVAKKSTLPSTTQQFYHHHKPSNSDQTQQNKTISRPLVPLTLAKYRRISSNVHLSTSSQPPTLIGATPTNSSNEFLNNSSHGIGINSNNSSTDAFNEHLMLNKRIEILKTPGKQQSIAPSSSSLSNMTFPPAPPPPPPPPPPSKRHFAQQEIKPVATTTTATSSSSLIPIDSTKVTIETIGSNTVSALLRQNATIEPVDTSRGVSKRLASLLTTASKEPTSTKTSYKQSSRDVIIDERFKFDSKLTNSLSSNITATTSTSSTYNPNKLPPVILNRKSTSKCFLCKKKTGLATTYQCRCGSSFCSEHRYPEAHACAFDYKAEGKRLIERNNPLVTAPKLPKI